MQAHLRKVCKVLLAVVLAGTAFITFGITPVFSQEEQQADKTLAPYFLVQGDPNVDHLPLKDTRVEISVSGVIADVKVRQIYRNEGARPINATYVFPASTRAAVYAMRMQLGNEIIVAKIKEREQAKKEFEQAKEEGKSASLLEQERPNVFSMSLANIMPQEQVEIELRYTELVVPTDNNYELVFPTVVGPRYAAAQDSKKENGFVQTPYLRQGQKPTSELHITARIAAGLPIYDLSCPSHQIVPQHQPNGVAQLTLDDSDPFQGNRDFVLRYRLAGDQIAQGLLLYPGHWAGRGRKLLSVHGPTAATRRYGFDSAARVHLRRGRFGFDGRFSAEHVKGVVAEAHRKPAADGLIQRDPVCRRFTRAFAAIACRERR